MLKKIMDMDIVTKMSIIGAIIVLMIIMAVVIVSCSNSEPAADIPIMDNDTTDTEDTVTEDDSDKEFARIIGVVSGIDTANGVVFITNVESQDKVVLTVPDNLQIQDAYGSIIALTQVYIGDLIESKYDINTNTPETFKISNQGWEYKGVQNLSIDEENKTIRLYNDLYYYTDDLVLYFGGEAIALSEIDPVDELVVRGFKDTVWSVSLENKHGYVVLIGTDNFIGGTVEISESYVTITNNTRVTVPVGVHKVIVTKEGFDPYVTEVTVTEDEEVIVDLSEIQAQIGSVMFSIVQDDAILYVDNVRINNLSEVVKLVYGPHDILVEKDGYLPWTAELYVNEPYLDYPIDLDMQKLMIKVDEPIETELLIDGVLIGEIPIQAPISQGTHVLTLQKEGYYSKTHNIAIDSDEGVFEFNFPPLVEDPNYVGGSVQVNVENPVGCELYVNSELVGTVPYSFEVPAGTHQLTLRKDGYYAKIYTVTVDATNGPYLYTFPDLVEIGSETTEPDPPEETPEEDITNESETPSDDAYQQ